MTAPAVLNFEKLEVWRKSIALADVIYSTTREFPAEERFGLTNQMRRAAVSISSNLAEGCSRRSKIDFARFVEISTGSAFELASQAHIAANLRWISAETHHEIRDRVLEIVRMLSGLRDSLKD
jgi:four helix bundle protein